jgi:hypothetical protein
MCTNIILEALEMDSSVCIIPFYCTNIILEALEMDSSVSTIPFYLQYFIVCEKGI